AAAAPGARPGRHGRRPPRGGAEEAGARRVRRPARGAAQGEARRRGGCRRAVARQRGGGAPLLDPVPPLGADGDVRPARPPDRRRARVLGGLVRRDRRAPRGRRRLGGRDDDRARADRAPARRARRRRSAGAVLAAPARVPGGPLGRRALRRAVGGRGRARAARWPRGGRRHAPGAARPHARRLVLPGAPAARRARPGVMVVAAPWEQLGETEAYAALVRQRIEHVVPVKEPLVLCSQFQRCGGSLLSQLFDGHPEVHAHPHDIKIGWPREANWPPIDLADLPATFERLFEKKALTHFLDGYQKRGAKLDGEPSPSFDVFPFVFLPRLQKAIFDACAAGAENARDVLDAYFTSYFNAWLDNHNLYAGPKKAVTGFTPRLAMDPGNRDELFAAYPDATLISIVREPQSWYLSASRYSP